MERRYLVAALAIVATFTVVSRGFRLVQHFSAGHSHQLGMMQDPQCSSGASTLSHWAAKLRTRLSPRYPEEAQMLAEMNVPIGIKAEAEAEAASESAAAAGCARETAQREAERARREAARQQARRADPNISPAPISFELNLPADFDQRIEVQTAALTQRLMAQQAKLQLATQRSLRISRLASDNDWQDATSGPGTSLRIHCRRSQSKQQTR